MNQADCPSCAEKGRKLHAVTPRSLLSEGALSRLTGDPEVRFCRNAACAVVYYADGIEPFATGDVRVPVFQKLTEPTRLVCYCFEHTVAAVEDEVLRTGASAVPDEIADKCRQGLDRCEEMNPQGSCCLGNVRSVVKAAAVRGNAPTLGGGGEDHACCSSEGGSGA